MCIRNTYNISYAHILFIPYFSTKWCVYLIYIYIYIQHNEKLFFIF